MVEVIKRTNDERWQCLKTRIRMIIIKPLPILSRSASSLLSETNGK